MLIMLSINRQLGKNMKNNEKYRTLIRQHDVGPWKDKDVTGLS
jgi:hypothetical protein